MVADFFQVYFIDPIKYNTGYNVVNTTVFAIILVAAVIATFKLLQKLNIKIDKNFFIGIAPFVALGGVLRSWEDLLEATKATAQLLESPIRDFILVDATGVPRNLLLISPLMYVTVFVIALAALLLSLMISKASRGKWQYYKVWFTIGAIIIAAVLLQLRFVNYFAMLLMLSIAASWLVLFYAAKKVNMQARKFFTVENYSILGIHMFDASTTFVSLQFFSYFEQHVVPSFFISLFGPVAMFFIKLPVVAAVLYYLDKDMKAETEKKNFIKIVILILGLGPGLRNFLRLGMGV